MSYYKDTLNNLHFLDNDDYSFMLPTGSVKITDQEAKQINSIPIEKIKANKFEEIKSKRDYLRFNGGIKVGDNWFLSTQIAATEYNSIINLEVSNTTVVRSNWRTMNGALVDMTKSLAKQIIAAGIQQAAAIDDAALAHKAAMEASADPAAYDFSGGWPETFGG